MTLEKKLRWAMGYTFAVSASLSAYGEWQMVTQGDYLGAAILALCVACIFTCIGIVTLHAQRLENMLQMITDVRTSVMRSKADAPIIALRNEPGLEDDSPENGNGLPS